MLRMASPGRADSRALKKHLLTLVAIVVVLDAIMIGAYYGLDIAGGRHNGTGTIGVLWGYGSRVELIAAEPDAVVDSMEALDARLREGGCSS